MAITGRTPNECFTSFRDHVSKLVTAVVATQAPVLHVQREPHRSVLSFANPQDRDAAVIETAKGNVYLHLTQHLHAEQAERGFKLRTREYRYAIYEESPGLLTEPLFRWEYETRDRQPHRGQPRHHLQFGRDSSLQHAELAGHKLDMNRVHLPTGWVLMEEIFRFLIHELGMVPPCGEDAWPDVLHRSESAFFDEFSTRNTTPPRQ